MDPTPQSNPNPGMQRAQEAEVPFLKILITALSVTDRPDLIDYRRKTSTKAGGGTEPSGSVGSKIRCPKSEIRKWILTLEALGVGLGNEN